MKKVLLALSLSTAVIAASSAYAQSSSIFTPACPDSSTIKIYSNLLISPPTGYTTLSNNIKQIDGNTIDFKDASFDLNYDDFVAKPQVLKSRENIKCEYSISNNGGVFVLTKDNSSEQVYTVYQQAGSAYWSVTYSPITKYGSSGFTMGDS